MGESKPSLKTYPLKSLFLQYASLYLKIIFPMDPMNTFYEMNFLYKLNDG